VSCVATASAADRRVDAVGAKLGDIARCLAGRGHHLVREPWTIITRAPAGSAVTEVTGIHW